MPSTFLANSGQSTRACTVQLPSPASQNKTNSFTQQLHHTNSSSHHLDLPYHPRLFHPACIFPSFATSLRPTSILLQTSRHHSHSPLQQWLKQLLTRLPPQRPLQGSEPRSRPLPSPCLKPLRVQPRLSLAVSRRRRRVRSVIPTTPSQLTVTDPNAPKRGLSAYMFFANDQRESVREDNPGISFGMWSFLQHHQHD